MARELEFQTRVGRREKALIGRASGFFKIGTENKKIRLEKQTKGFVSFEV
jgi:hypothetical protein